MKGSLIKSLAMIGVLVFAVVGVSSCSRETKSTVVRAAYVPAGYYLPFLVVEHEKLLEKRGYSIELQQFQDNAQMVSMFVNGHLDVTAQSAFTVFPIATEYPNTFRFLYGQFAGSYFFMVPTNSQVQELSDLRGLTIGTWKSPTAEQFIRLLLRSAGLQDDEYTIQRFGAQEWAPALENGVVPAVFGFDIPLAVLAATGNYRYIGEDAFSDLLSGQQVFNGGAFVSEQLIEQDPKKARAIREALLEAVTIIQGDREGTASRVAAAALGASVEVVARARLDEFVAPSRELRESAERTARLLSDEGLMEALPAVGEMFWIGD